LTGDIPNRYLTATSTDLSGNTSRFSEPFDYTLTTKQNIPIIACVLTNYPNPIKQGTNIEYQLHKNTDIAIEIYSPIGTKIKTLVKKKQTAGNYSIFWDMRDEKGTIVDNGTYLCVLKTELYMATCKLIIIR
jgi:hypothetical protein